MSWKTKSQYRKSRSILGSKNGLRDLPNCTIQGVPLLCASVAHSFHKARFSGSRDSALTTVSPGLERTFAMHHELVSCISISDELKRK